MKSSFYLILLCTCTCLFSQNKATNNFLPLGNKVLVSTLGLDYITITNTNTKHIEVTLFAENPNKQHIIFEDINDIAAIKFKIPTLKNEDKIFRKFITERLERAFADIKIPKNMEVVIIGENTDIYSKSYQGNLDINLEKGTVKLDTIKKNVILKLFVGNVYGTFSKTNLDIVASSGKIIVDSIIFSKNYKKKLPFTSKELIINSVKANIFLTSQ